MQKQEAGQRKKSDEKGKKMLSQMYTPAWFSVSTLPKRPNCSNPKSDICNRGSSKLKNASGDENKEKFYHL